MSAVLPLAMPTQHCHLLHHVLAAGPLAACCLCCRGSSIRADLEQVGLLSRSFVHAPVVRDSHGKHHAKAFLIEVRCQALSGGLCGLSVQPAFCSPRLLLTMGVL